jgi:hypothetical protein
MLNFSGQAGAQMGFNGMADGGKRRVTIDRALVCDGRDAGCGLPRPERQFVNEFPVDKKALVV